jgi:hypothetical protein
MGCVFARHDAVWSVFAFDHRIVSLSPIGEFHFIAGYLTWGNCLANKCFDSFTAKTPHGDYPPNGLV